MLLVFPWERAFELQNCSLKYWFLIDIRLSLWPVLELLNVSNSVSKLVENTQKGFQNSCLKQNLAKTAKSMHTKGFLSGTSFKIRAYFFYL